MTVDSKDLFLSIVGKENVKDTQAQLLAYSYDATAKFQPKPDVVD